ncbi:MAG: hypothetical protein FJY56_02800 [Betaproteobacteria bacterium]|nr:hypothetical protein [Betaproteobacteria bacterium]
MIRSWFAHGSLKTAGACPAKPAGQSTRPAPASRRPAPAPPTQLTPSRNALRLGLFSVRAEPVEARSRCNALRPAQGEGSLSKQCCTKPLKKYIIKSNTYIF